MLSVRDQTWRRRLAFVGFAVVVAVGFARQEQTNAHVRQLDREGHDETCEGLDRTRDAFTGILDLAFAGRQPDVRVAYQQVVDEIRCDGP